MNRLSNVHFEILIYDLRNQFKPEIIEMKQQKIEPLKRIQKNFKQCIIHPDMNEHQTEEVRRMMPDLPEFIDEQPYECNADEETEPILAPFCIPV